MDIISISCIYPYFVDIIRIFWKYPRSVDIIHIPSVISLAFYSSSESDCCRILRLIIKDYGTEIYYIQGNKHIVADALSQLSNNGNQNTTHDFNCIMETMLEIYVIDKLPEGTFPIYFYKYTCLSGIIYISSVLYWIKCKI